jgi:hypothetical protein
MAATNDMDIQKLDKESPIEVNFLMDKQSYTDYPYDILNTYFEKEQKRIAITGVNHQDIRDYLIAVIKCYARNKKYAFSTVHLAVLYLDIYMDNYILSTFVEHQKFVALVALILACKIEEIDENIPSIKELLYIINLSDELDFDIKEYRNHQGLYEPQQVFTAFKVYMNLYCTIEYSIFRSLEFNAIRPTAITFLNVFQNMTVTENDLSDIYEHNPSIHSVTEIKQQIHEYLKLLSEILLHDISFHRFLPSRVAASMIATIRKLLNIERIWTVQLEFLTHATLKEVTPIMDIFFDKLLSETSSEDSLEVAGDSGFQSYDSTSLELSDEEINHLKNCKKLKTDC